MDTARFSLEPAYAWMARVFCACLCVVAAMPAGAVGTAVGTIIENTAEVSYDLAGAPQNLQSNTTTVAVAERINVTATLQSPQLDVDAGDSIRALLFMLTNTGNGTETFQLSVNSVVAGDDFDPVTATPAIYFDSDGSGDLNSGDQAYAPGSNDPQLLADESIGVFVVNDIPAGLPNGAIGRSELNARSATGSGDPGTVFPGLGDGGVNAVIGLTRGEASAVGEYRIAGVLINVVKSQLVSDPFGGNEPVPGATLTYTISVEVASAGTATASVVRDPIPTNTSYIPNSITLNGNPVSDPVDGDAGEMDTTTVPTVVVRLGDLTQADAIQIIVFKTVID